MSTDRSTRDAHVEHAITRATRIVGASEEFQRAYYARYLPDQLLHDLGAAGVRREQLRVQDPIRRVA